MAIDQARNVEHPSMTSFAFSSLSEKASLKWTTDVTKDNETSEVLCKWLSWLSCVTWNVFVLPFVGRGNGSNRRRIYECVTISACTTANANVAENVNFPILVSLFPEGRDLPVPKRGKWFTLLLQDVERSSLQTGHECSHVYSELSKCCISNFSVFSKLLSIVILFQPFLGNIFILCCHGIRSDNARAVFVFFHSSNFSLFRSFFSSPGCPRYF